MSALAQRLARLRAQGGARPSLRRDVAVHEVRDTLRRLLGVRERLGSAVAMPAATLDRQPPGLEIAAGLRYAEHVSDWPETPLDIDAGFAGLGRIDADRVLCFDTETTGLAGGTGTRAFQIGAGDWHAGRFRIRQLTLTTLAAEGEMLRQFASWLHPGVVLVSYNGRSYDAPLLSTRYRLARQVNPLGALPHLDLLHPTRRRYRGRWENCRLATIERHALGIVREDDLPGSEAPRAWLDFLRGGSAVNLRRVAQHNAQDLRSLAALLLHLGEVSGAEPAAPA